MLWFVEHFFCGSRCCDIKVCGFYGKFKFGFCGFSTVTSTATTTATTTATASTERLFEVLRVYWLVFSAIKAGGLVRVLWIFSEGVNNGNSFYISRSGGATVSVVQWRFGFCGQGCGF